MSIEQLAYETLHTTYKKAFEDVSMYAIAHYLSGEKYEEAMLNLYDVLFQAQADGQPVEKIIGKDVEEFCKYYFADYGLQDVTRTLSKQIVGYTVIVYLFEWLVAKNETMFNIGKTIFLVVVWILLEQIGLRLKKVFFQSTSSSMYYFVMLLINLCLVIGLGQFINISFMVSQDISRLGVVLFVGCQLFYEYFIAKNLRSSRKYVDNIVKKYRREKSDKENFNRVIQTLEKRYRNKKNNLDWYNFLKKEYDRLIREQNYLKYGIILIDILAILLAYFVGNNTIQDAMMFGAVNAIVGFGIYMLSKKQLNYVLSLIDKLLIDAEGETHYEQI